MKVIGPKIQGHAQEKNVAEVVNATWNEGFLLSDFLQCRLARSQQFSLTNRREISTKAQVLKFATLYQCSS